MAKDQMDFATALGKLCDRYGVKVLLGAGAMEGNIVLLDKTDDIPCSYAVKRYNGFFALENVDENHS